MREHTDEKSEVVHDVVHRGRNMVKTVYQIKQMTSLEVLFPK